jgi:hypothetical protein
VRPRASRGLRTRNDGITRARAAELFACSDRGWAAVLAYGRDPDFAGWPDTLQLNYANPELQEARVLELGTIAETCDGVRCDMAMLILPDVFEKTWGVRPAPFWSDAIKRTKSRSTAFFHGRGLLGSGMDLAAAGF